MISSVWGDLVTPNKQFPITGNANEIGGNAKPYYSGLVTAQTKYGRLWYSCVLALLFDFTANMSIYRLSNE